MEETLTFEVDCVGLTLKHIITELLKYERDQHRMEMEKSFNTTLGPKTVAIQKLYNF